jgi:hypothetical protein
MGIKFTCPACGRALNVKSELAGKRGRCPNCQAKVDIPAESAVASDANATGAVSSQASPAGPTGAVNPATDAGFLSVEEQTTVWPKRQPAPNAGIVDPITEAPNLQWYALPPGAAGQYGPVTGDDFRTWLGEGRITADALVWRQDWPNWKRAGEVFPQLGTAALLGFPPMPAGAAPMAAAATAPSPAFSVPPLESPFPAPGAVSGAFAGASTAPADAFPAAPTTRAGTRSAAVRSRGSRKRSNTGPLIAIVVLLLALIPLSYLVWMVVTDQFGLSQPETAAPASSNQSEE